MPTIRDAHFVPEWINMEPPLPEPRIDWIEKKWLDLPYGPDPAQKLDVYRPNGAESQNLPIVLLVHGGAFRGFDKRDIHIYPGFFSLENGFILASTNYRLAPQHPFPSGLCDVLQAIQYLQRNAAQFGADGQKIFLYGISAGGSLVSIAGLIMVKRADNPIAGVAALCPVISFTKLWDQVKNDPDDSDIKVTTIEMYRQYLTTTPKEFLAYEAVANVETYLTDIAPPFYIQHGTDDYLPMKQSTEFYDLLKAATPLTDRQLVLDILEGAQHASDCPDFCEKENITPILEFFKNQL